MTWNLQGKQSITIWIKQIQRQIWTLENGKKTFKMFIQNNFAKGRHGQVALHVSIHVRMAYMLHARQIGHLRNLMAVFSVM